MNIILAGQYAGALLAITACFGMLVKWVVLKPIKLYIDQATYQIHPDANGGKSLADVSKTVTRIEAKQSCIENRLVAIEDLVTKPRTKKPLV